MRAPSDSDFVISLDGVGEFRFASPTIRDLIRIDKEYAAIVGDAQPGVRLNVLATMIAIYKATMVSCPNGWEDIEALSGKHDADIANLLMLYREKEDSFRGGAEEGGKATGA